jgi:two-component system KDP operon response regulator KdpE
MTASQPPRIAITDRNPHVRELLCRELAALGLAPEPLTGPGDILASLASAQPPVVLVLDPEAAAERLAELSGRLSAMAGRVAVVLHVYDGAEAPGGFVGARVVEKRPDMGALKAVLMELAAGGTGARGAA